MEDTVLNKIPSRVKYYLLDWKDNNMEEYIRMYGLVSLRDLTVNDLRNLFKHAVKNETF
ncbi:MAG: hypothetical protein ACOC22_01465 [bacterium]